MRFVEAVKFVDVPYRNSVSIWMTCELFTHRETQMK